MDIPNKNVYFCIKHCIFIHYMTKIEKISGFNLPKGDAVYTQEYIQSLRDLDRKSPDKLKIIAQKGAQERILSVDADIKIVGGSRGGPLERNTIVLTKDGKKAIKDIECGDIVFGVNRKEIKVLSRSDYSQLDCFVITLENGKQITCSDDHVWCVILENKHAEIIGNTHAFITKEGTEGGSKKNEGNEGSESEIMKELKNLRAELDEERNARKQEQTERAKHATMDSVRKGLREKFENAGLKLNDFFAKSALSKLEIPSENVDVKSLIEKAERLYNADIKEAGIEIGKPHAGGNGSGKEEKEDWSDVSNIVGRYNPKTE